MLASGTFTATSCSTFHTLSMLSDRLLESAVRAYVEETAQQIDHYLGLHMQVAEVRLVPGLSAFAAENLK